MTSLNQPHNQLIQDFSVDTLCNIEECLLFVNDYINQLSEAETLPAKEVLSGLNRHLDHSIEALVYEKERLTNQSKPIDEWETENTSIRNPLIHSTKAETLHHISLALASLNDQLSRQAEGIQEYPKMAAVFEGMSLQVRSIQEAVSYEEDRE